EVNVVKAVEVLEQPGAGVVALELGVAARHVGVRQADVAGSLAANEVARAVQFDVAPPPLAVEDLEVLHGTTPLGLVRSHPSSSTTRCASIIKRRRGRMVSESAAYNVSRRHTFLSRTSP